MDRWGNYHSELVAGDDILLKYSYWSGRAPRESWATTVITTNGRVHEVGRVGETLESFCHEHGELTEELKQAILREVEREAKRGRMKLEVNEENLAKAPELRTFVEKLKQAYYCNAYPHSDLCEQTS
jgi:hypothetical protein